MRVLIGTIGAAALAVFLVNCSIDPSTELEPVGTLSQAEIDYTECGSGDRVYGVGGDEVELCSVKILDGSGAPVKKAGEELTCKGYFNSAGKYVTACHCTEDAGNDQVCCGDDCCTVDYSSCDCNGERAECDVTCEPGTTPPKSNECLDGVPVAIQCTDRNGKCQLCAKDFAPPPPDPPCADGGEKFPFVECDGNNFNSGCVAIAVNPTTGEECVTGTVGDMCLEPTGSPDHSCYCIYSSPPIF